MPPHHWQFNAEGDQTPEEFGRLLQTIGEQLEAGGHVAVRGLEQDLPRRVHTVVRKERTPHGHEILKFQTEWADGNGDAASRSLDDLFDA